MKNLKKFYALIFVSSAFLLSACNDGPMEEAGEDLDAATENARENVEEAAEETGEAVNEACNEITGENC